MHKKLSETWSKFPAITCGYFMVKFAHLDDAFFEVFFNCKQAHKNANHCSKKKEKGEKEKRKKKVKTQKPNMERRLKILISMHARAKMS